MKLRKQICRSCIDREATVRWSDADDRQWERGSLDCPVAGMPGMPNTLLWLPKDCLCAAEHLVCAETSEAIWKQARPK